MHSGDAVYFGTPLTPLLIYSTAWVMPTSVLLVAALAILVSMAVRRHAARWPWMAVPLILVAVLELLISWVAPGASYLLEWPLAAGPHSARIGTPARRGVR